MAATAKQVQEKFLEFAQETESRIDVFLADALKDISPSEWGGDADNAQMLLAAHLLCTVGCVDGTNAVEPGVVKKEKVGEVATEWAVASPTGVSSEEDSLKTTTYGREFLRIKRRIQPRRYSSSRDNL